MSCQPDVFELVRNRIGFVSAALIREWFRSVLRLARNQRSRLARTGYGLDWLESRPHMKKSRGSPAAAHTYSTPNLDQTGPRALARWSPTLSFHFAPNRERLELQGRTPFSGGGRPFCCSFSCHLTFCQRIFRACSWIAYHSTFSEPELSSWPPSSPVFS